MNLNKLYEKINSMVALDIFNYSETQKSIESEFAQEFLFLNNLNNDLFRQEDDDSQLKILSIYDIYFRNGAPLISDNHYDGFYKIYSDAQLEPMEPIMFEPSISAWGKVEHDIPMGSLDKQSSIEDIEKWNSKKGIAGKPTVISEKMDGISCLHGDSLIELIDGTKKSIKDIVDEKLQVAVKSYNLTSKEIEFKMVTGHQAKHNNGKKWLRVMAKNSSGEVVELITTHDHLWYCSNIGDYVELKALKIGDRILYSQ